MTRGRVGSLSSLRELNRLKVLEVVRERGTVSRSQIASATGLARSTVSTLVGELQRAGLVVEREDVQAASAASGGRPPLMLSLDPGAGAVIGIQFDHDFVRVAIADLSLTILAEGARQADVDHDAHAGLSTAAELVDSLLGRGGRRARATRRRRRGAVGPRRPRHRAGELVDDPARLGRRRRRIVAERAPRRPGRGRQRRQPRCARRVGAGRRARRHRDGVRDAVLGHRRWADPGRPSLPRRARDGRRARATSRSTTAATCADAATADASRRWSAPAR